MTTKFSQLVSSIFEYQSGNINLWADIFGNNLSQTWSDFPKTYLNIIEFAKDRLNNHGENEIRDGNLCLFFKDPFSDRLVLKFSTVDALNPTSYRGNIALYVNKESNYDNQNKISFYRLFDSIVEAMEKKCEAYRKGRGLTGWVAVSGQPLRVNNERAKERLDDIPFDNPAAKDACEIYGTPIWGNHISEFPNLHKNISWSIRYLAVPIKSVYDENITIGVLRYSCTAASSAELTHFELFFLEEVARVIASVNNLERMQRNLQRESQLDDEVNKLNKTKRFHPFLSFVTTSLRSNISSLYLFAGLRESRKVLRLFDAYGISDDVDNIRESISDYNKSSSGLTWYIFNLPEVRPTIVESVIDNDQWKGLNTKIFYERVLREVCDLDDTSCLTNLEQIKRLLKRYIIKLIGVPIQYGSKRIGVLKVEFPSTYDIGYDFKDEAFIKKCSDAIAKELELFSDFLSTKWFDTADSKNAQEFVSLYTEIGRIKFFKEKDSEYLGTKLFEEKVKAYIKKYGKHVKSAFSQYAIEYIENEEDKMEFKSIFEKISPWLGPIIIQAISKVIESL